MLRLHEITWFRQCFDGQKIKNKTPGIQESRNESLHQLLFLNPTYSYIVLSVLIQVIRLRGNQSLDVDHDCTFSDLHPRTLHNFKDSQLLTHLMQPTKCLIMSWWTRLDVLGVRRPWSYANQRESETGVETAHTRKLSASSRLKAQASFKHFNQELVYI